MIREQFPTLIEDRIKREKRRGRAVQTGNAKSLYFRRGTGKEVAPSIASGQFAWQGAYISEEKDFLTGVNTASSRLQLVVDHQESGSGVFNIFNKEWDCTGKTFTLNEWADHYLKVGDNYYKILSNTVGAPGILTLDLEDGQVITDGSYEIFPFIPNMLIGQDLIPDDSGTATYTIVRNTNVSIFIGNFSGRLRNVGGDVTTGDASAPYKTFRCDTFDGYQDDHWNGFTVVFKDGDNVGESDNIEDFTGSTGEFILATGLTNTIDIGDSFQIFKGLAWVPVGATFKITTGYTPSSSDFEDASSEDVKFRDLYSLPDGGLIDFNQPKPFVGRYAIEVYSESTKTFTAPLSFRNGSVRVDLRDLATDTVDTIYQSMAEEVSTVPVLFNLGLRSWYRIEIYYYYSGQRPGGVQLGGIQPFVNAWRDITPNAPTWVSVTGADGNNDPDPDTAREGDIILSWKSDVFLGKDGNTEIWRSDTEGGTYTFYDRVSSEAEVFAFAEPESGATRWFKIRHVSASGVIGLYSAAHKGITVAAGTGNTDIVIAWVDDVDAAVYPNGNGWYDDAILKAKITVTTDLTISAIKFTRTGAAQVDLGASSPATSAAVTETTEGVASVLVEFTNGLSSTQTANYRYDKTAPVAPVLEALADVANFEINVYINTAASDALSGIDGLEWGWNEVDINPDINTKALLFNKGDDGDLFLGMAQYDYDSTTLYVWVRALDNAGNKSAWVQFGGGSGFVDLSVREVTGVYEVVDLLEFKREV